MAIDTGGQAYPRNERNDDGTHHCSHEGMNLLDAAAIAALHVAGPYLTTYLPAKAAKIAYDMAEAMVAEKRKRENV